MPACLISHPAPASPASWSFIGTSKTCKRALSRRQRRQLHLEPHAPGGCLPTVCGATAFTHSTALGRHRSNDTLGVVIVNEGRRSSESDEILMDVAACYKCVRTAVLAPVPSGTQTHHPLPPLLHNPEIIALLFGLTSLPCPGVQRRIIASCLRRYRLCCLLPHISLSAPSPFCVCVRAGWHTAASTCP